MAKRPAPPEDHPAFAGLPVRQIGVGGGESVAVHIRGTITADRMPLVVLAGYHRNMSDYANFVPLFRGLAGHEWPVVLVDFVGRGRATSGSTDHTTVRDSAHLTTVCDALGIHKAVFLGQAYGGQVAMTVGAHRATLIGGSILVDAGPMTDPRGLVRLRNNLRHLGSRTGENAVRDATRTVLRTDYPELRDEKLDELALRTHFFTKRWQVRPLFDPKLIDQLDAFEVDDVLASQWPLFNSLGNAPMMLIRTQLSDLLRRDTFEAMTDRRPDAVGLTIPDQGSPALLDGADEVGSIADFVVHAQSIRDAASRMESV